MAHFPIRIGKSVPNGEIVIIGSFRFPERDVEMPSESLKRHGNDRLVQFPYLFDIPREIESDFVDDVGFGHKESVANNDSRELIPNYENSFEWKLQSTARVHRFEECYHF